MIAETRLPVCHEIALSNHMKVTLEYDPDGSRTAILWNEANEPIADGDAPILAALAHPPAQGSESGGEVEGAARALLDACYTADENSDLSDFIDGTLLTRLDRALSARVLAALSPQPGPASEGDGE